MIFNISLGSSDGSLSEVGPSSSTNDNVDDVGDVSDVGDVDDVGDVGEVGDVGDGLSSSWNELL